MDATKLPFEYGDASTPDRIDFAHEQSPIHVDTDNSITAEA